MSALGVAAPFQIHANTININEKTRTDVQNWTVSWPVGPTTGWHYHVGWLMVIITAGAVTTYNKTKTGCAPVTYRKGQVFVELPFRVHNAVNAGHVAAAGVSSEFITHGKQETVNVARPANCPQI
jgi:quercetin dioxygenase-like cupin family protein